MKLIREKCCCFTGHRRVPELEGLWIRRQLRERMTELYQEGVDTFIAGGALGFDTMAAQEVVRMRDKGAYPFRLVLALPYPGQEAGWPPQNISTYQGLLRTADEAIYLSDFYEEDCLLRRNRYMVDNSSCCICYLTTKRGRGGTVYTVKYAMRAGVRLIYLVNQSGAQGMR